MKPDAPRNKAVVSWTKEQLAGIRTVGRSLLVSAAAGSGKTSVLAERCVHLVCDADPRCDVDELLVVTFTKDAAREMRTRVEASLRKRLAAVGDDDERVVRQLSLIGRAQISTIHSFCTSVLRQNFHLIGLDPGFKTLDEHEAVLLRGEVAREVFARRYEQTGKRDAFIGFVDDYGDGNDEPLMTRVIRLHEMLTSVVDPVGWIARIRSVLSETASRPLCESELGRELSEIVRARLTGLARRCTDLRMEIDRIRGLEAYGKQVHIFASAVDEFAAAFGAGDFDCLAAAVSSWEPPRLPPIKNPPPEKERVQAAINAIKKEIREGDFAGVSRFSEAEWRDGVARTLPSANVLLDLVESFGREYTAAKRELRSVDFSDLERLTLNVLREEGTETLTPSLAARAYHRRFHHVLVDEYQDVNALQDAILFLLSRDCLTCETGGPPKPGEVPNLFCVGDVKQSIYRFRLAEPAQFLARRERFLGATDGFGQVIDLQTNFRSRAAVLTTINGLFERLMTQAAMEIEYDVSHRLHSPTPCAYESHPVESAGVELHVLPAPGRGGESDADAADETSAEAPDRTEREAAFVAYRIHDLLGHTGAPPLRVLGKTAAGPAGLRDVRPGDIAILLRATRVKAGQFTSLLRAARLSVHSDSTSGFFESLEIRDMLSLLRVLDNRRQDVPLAALIRSPLSGVDRADDCLASIRLAAGESGVSLPFHLAVVRYKDTHRDEAARSLGRLFQRLDAWRETAHQRPLSELIRKIFDDTAYLTWCAGLPDGEQRVANLLELHERSRQFGTFQKQGLRRFLQFLDNLCEQSDLGTPSVASQADDAVRVMSIHKSKGLEFPVVFVCDLGKAHNMQDLSGRIVVDRGAGVGMEVIDPVRQIIYPSLASTIVKERLRRQTLAEELRVLYVAATRAREKLILVGTADADACEGWRDRWSSHRGPLPADDVLGGRTMLDWVGPAACAMLGDSAAGIQLHAHTDEELQDLMNFGEEVENTFRASTLARLQPLNPPAPESESARRIVDDLRWSYPVDLKPFTALGAARSVSDLTKHGRTAPSGRVIGRDVVAFDRVLAPARCCTTDRTPKATDVGSVTHGVLEHLDFQAAFDAESVASQVARMAESHLIRPELAAAVDVDSIVWLMSTPVGGLLARHQSVLRRELPFFFPADGGQFADLPPAIDPLDRVMVRGRLDVLIPLPGGAILIDFKTDDVTEAAVAARAEFYRAQLDAYREAVERMLRSPLKAAYLVFLRPRMIQAC